MYSRARSMTDCGRDGVSRTWFASRPVIDAISP
jgi:hypothetical protein